MMSILDVAIGTENIRTCLEEDFDVILPDHPCLPEDKQGRIHWSQTCQCFATDSDGGQYLLLEDRTVGYFSCDGQAGRIADNLQEFFLMVVNFGHWQDFCVDQPADQLIQKHSVTPAQEKLSELLDVPLFSDRQILISRFIDTVQRQPGFTAFYQQEDGTMTCSPSLLMEAVEEKEITLNNRQSTDQDREELVSRYGLIR